MIILTIRTDKPEAEIGLFEDGKKLAYKKWPAHRQLAESLHAHIRDLLALQGCTLLQGATLQDKGFGGVVCFRGPGSFTGLRIGLTVANTLAYGLDIPVVGSEGDSWIGDGIKKLKAGKNEQVVLPEYGSEPHTTTPKK